MAAGDFFPRLIGFLCNWCSYAGADLAGVSRFQYPPNLRVVRLMCSGRLNPVTVLDTFLLGADGVLVGGCHIGDCHYIEGNQYALRVVEMLKVVLDRAGLAPGRLRLEWVSASEGQRFAEVVSDFTERVRALGPSPVGTRPPDAEMVRRLEAARGVVGDFRVRALLSKGYVLTTRGNAWGEVLPEDHARRVVLEAAEEEYHRRRILDLTGDRAMSVGELAASTGLTPQDVLAHVVRLRQRNLLGLDSIDGRTPRYRRLEGAV
jgi:F420-non-reducing hydrogenase iron-sulfur subunit